MEGIIVELYCGSATISNVFRANGFSTLSIDIRKRTGTCLPDFRFDILKLKPGDITIKLLQMYPEQMRAGVPLIFWGSPLCQRFSYAAGDLYYYKGRLRKEYALESTKHLQKCQMVIEEIKPVFYFIENPRGHLRHEPILIDWLTENNGMTKLLMYSAYGSDYPKPTNLFTNALNYTPRPLTKWGKGAKYSGNMNNLTTHQRQQIPLKLAQEICKWSIDNLPGATKCLDNAISILD